MSKKILMGMAIVTAVSAVAFVGLAALGYAIEQFEGAY